MTRNPHQRATEASRSAIKQGQFLVGKVESVDDEKHVARVRFSSDESKWCELLVDSKGDYSLPPRETHVVVAQRAGSSPIVLGTVYGEADDLPSAAGSDGERVVGHPASDTKIRFNADGSYEIIHDDGSTAVTVDESGVTLGDGTTNPIARKGDSVEVTDTNGNTLTGTITEGSPNNESN